MSRRVELESGGSSPSSFLFVHVGDDGVLDEGQLVVSLGLVLVHGSHCALQGPDGRLRTREHTRAHASTRTRLTLNVGIWLAST